MNGVVITNADAVALIKAYDILVAWIGDHADNCECGQRVLNRLDKAGQDAGRVIDKIQEGLNRQ